jgi:methylmalonyl-CoA mutase N-terminal domain/subunit
MAVFLPISLKFHCRAFINKGVRNTVKDCGQEKEGFVTESGIALKKLYKPEDLKGREYDQDLGDAGQFPFTRGIHPGMYTDRLWTIRQYAGFGSGEDANARYKFLIKQGQTGLNVALDLPTQMGFDSDDPQAEGEVGRVGVAVDTLEDMERIFDGIPLEKISAAFTVNATAGIILAMYIAVAEKQGVPVEKIRGTVQNDILKEYLARGTYIFPPAPSIRLACDIIEYCLKNVPRFNAISISGHMNEAGATGNQTAAYMFLNARVHIDEIQARGFSVDQIAPLIAFFTTAKEDFFESIAIVRASRRIWAKLMRESYGASDQRSLVYRIALAADCGNLIARQPLNNITRIAVRALSCILAGCQSMALPAYDEAYAIPSEETARVSLMMQHILAHETGIPAVIDPLGGSYYVECLTNECEKKINEIMAEVENQGGMLKIIEKGEIQRKLTRQLFQKEKDIQTGIRKVIGLNKYLQEDEDLSQLEGQMHEYDPAVQQRQIESLRRVKSERDNERVTRLLKELKDIVQSGENVMPAIIAAVKEYATVGEIVRVIEEVYGRFKAPTGV